MRSLFSRVGHSRYTSMAAAHHGPSVMCVRHFARLGKRKSDVKRHSKNNKSAPSVALDLCAHIVGPQIKQSFAECKEFLLENPEHVGEFEKDMRRTGMTIVYSNEEVRPCKTLRLCNTI